MDFQKKNIFGNQVFRNQVKFNQTPVLTSTVSNLKAMSLDPKRKTQVLSTLARFQGQMNPDDYNEILGNIKSVNEKEPFGENKKELSEQEGITDKQYRATVSSLRQLEREMRN